MYKQRIKDAIESIKKGEMIIIMDDEDRENEGDLVMAGIFSTPQKINFMAQEARGLICVSITKDIAEKLDLPPMVQNNNSNHETAFTISIDAKEAKTGISAYERDMTIKLMCNNNATPSDFVRPGHIFPLIAKEGGVLVRTGHTEASVDICRLAGVAPISVICEIMKKDGTMAGRGDKFLLDFAKEHNLKILYVSDIIQYRLNFENLLYETSRENVEFMNAKCEKITFCDHLQKKHIVFKFNNDGLCNKDIEKEIRHITIADIEESIKIDSVDKNKNSGILIKFHNIKSDLELLENTKEFVSLLKSIEKLRCDGGYLIFLNTESKQYGDIKDFGVGAQILKRLNIEKFRLLSSSNKNEYNAIKGFNLHLTEKVEI